MVMSMLEQVVEAIDTCALGRTGKHLPEFLVRHLAVAAIETMLKPTEEMVKAGTISWEPLDGSPIRAMFDPMMPYQAMIRKALDD